MNIIIVAGGNGTRFNTLSVFPKVLLPFVESNSILERDIKVFGSHVHLIMNSKFYDMTKNYLDINGLSDKITLYRSENTNGSYNSIKYCMETYEGFPKEDVLFVWSDLILNEAPNVGTNTIFTCSGKYRYAFDGISISLCKDYDGNVPGVYFIKDLNRVFLYKLDEMTNFDLVDAIKMSGEKFNKSDLNDIIELRDYDTYVNMNKDYSNSELHTRFFNSLTVEPDGKLKKQAIDPKYFDIIEKEFKWYKYGYENIKDFDRVVPSIDLDSFKDHSFKMEFLKNYIPLYKYLKSTDDKAKAQQLYSNIHKFLDILHSTSIEVSKETFATDLKVEVVDKVIKRCESIKHFLLEYDRDELVKVLDKAYKYLLGLEGDKVRYSFTHGDINGSNMMVNKDNLDVRLIDPRGYFGNTKLYGWPRYEYAKLLYCLYGYDDFNNNTQIYKKDWPKKFWCADDIEFLNTPDLKILVGIIYIALAGYISQDIMKANIAYEYGLKMLKEELEYV